jgi:hypothetical protein
MKKIFIVRGLAIILAAAILFLLPVHTARADTGPKPSMSFTFVYKIEPAPTILSGSLLECSDPACTDATALKQEGPQHFSCSTTSCDSLAYGYSKYHQLSIEFSDGKTRLSNVFTKTAFDAVYTVTVQEDALLVSEKLGGPPLNLTGSLPFDLSVWACGGCFYLILWGLLIAYLITAGKPGATFKSMVPLYISIWLVSAFMLVGGVFLSKGLLTTVIVEVLLGLGYALWRKRPLVTLLTTILLLNLATQPALWMTIRALDSRYSWIAISFAEGIVWLVEAVGLFLVQRKSVKFTEMLLLSLVLNLASFGVGLFLAI